MTKAISNFLLIILLTGCVEVTDGVKDIIGVYNGNVTFSEAGKEPVKTNTISVKLTIFTDDVPTSSKYRAKIEIDTYSIPGIENPYKKDSILVFPEIITVHNIVKENGKYLLRISEAETTADFGFPIPFPVNVDGIIDESLNIKINIKIASSYGSNREFIFEGKKQWLSSIPVRMKNLTSPLEKEYVTVTKK